MQTRILIALAAAAALVAACDRNEPKSTAQPSSTGGASQVQSSGSATGNGTGVQSSAAAASGKATGEGAQPHQQQVDPKQPEQRRDFQERGDQGGPSSPQTSPKPGS